jgi:TM2 domain-containing membrane protein YozV
MNYKNKTILIILSYVFGIFGADRFYLGCTGSGIAKLLTFGGFGIWYTIDLVFILANGYNKSKKQVICGNYKWEKQSIKNGYKATLVVLALFALKIIFGISHSFLSL